MKSIIVCLALIFGVATIATVVLPSVAFACQAGDPGCGG